MAEVPSASPTPPTVRNLRPPLAHEIDTFLMQIEGVAGVRTEVDAQGRVYELHVLAAGTVPVKPLARNIESAVRTQFGLALDRRVISIAPMKPEQATASPPPSTATPAPSVPARPTMLRTLPRRPSTRPCTFVAAEVDHGRVRPNLCRITLEVGDKCFVGVADGRTAGPTLEMMAAQATLAALRSWDESIAECRLEGAKTIHAFDATMCLVGIWIPGVKEPYLVTGSAVVTDRREVAAAAATLDAMNRWLAGHDVSTPHGGPTDRA